MAEKGALFVCLGNICRSPIAEACMKSILQEKGILQKWNVDSAATSGHEAGSTPDDRGQSCMKAHGVYELVSKHRARKITRHDYETFDFIFGMDENNMSDLRRMAPKSSKAKLLLLGSFDEDKSFGGIIEDPYYSSRQSDFEVVYQQCFRSCKNFLHSINL